MLILVATLALVVLLLLAEMPIAFAFGIGAFLFGIVSGSDVSFLIPHAYQTTSSFALLALPLFVMAGTLMAQGGISDRLLDFVGAFVGRLKGDSAPSPSSPARCSVRSRAPLRLQSPPSGRS